MMKAIVKFYENSIRIITESQEKNAKKVTMGYIEQTLGGEDDVISKINNMKFKKPDLPEHQMRREFDEIHALIDQRFQDLQF